MENLYILMAYPLQLDFQDETPAIIEEFLHLMITH